MSIDLRMRVLLIGILLLMACNSSYTPRPRGYFAIDFPQRAYQVFDQPGFPYSFEYPVYAKVVRDTSFFGEATENPWWINIDFPQFGGKIHISYKAIGNHQLNKLVNDAFVMTNKHNLKAYSIEDSLMRNPAGVPGVYFKVGGDVATAHQFFLTDSTRHFLRGALYFDATPNEDSLRPVNAFLQAEMKHLIQTFRWKQ